MLNSNHQERQVLHTGDVSLHSRERGRPIRQKGTEPVTRNNQNANVDLSLS